MLTFRTLLSVAMIAVGAIVVSRMLAAGVRLEIVPGIVLGGAMIALGIHRLSLILRVWKTRS